MFRLIIIVALLAGLKVQASDLCVNESTHSAGTAQINGIQKSHPLFLLNSVGIDQDDAADVHWAPFASAFDFRSVFTFEPSGVFFFEVPRSGISFKRWLFFCQMRN